MAYNEDLAVRIKKLVQTESGLSEKKMFGGIAFLIFGNMAVAASSHGGLLVRSDPAKTDELLTTTTAQAMVMRGHSMPGWLRISSEDVESDTELKRWVATGVSYARTLPPKHKNL